MLEVNLEYNETLYMALISADIENIHPVIPQISMECALINPALIYDYFQVTVAANKTVIAKHLSKMVTKSLSTELLYNLSLSRNITHSLATFGPDSIKQKNCLILVAVVNVNGPQGFNNIFQKVPGNLCDKNDLLNVRDLNLIRKLYDIKEYVQGSQLLDIIVTKIVCKGV